MYNKMKLKASCWIPYICTSRKDKIIVTESVLVGTRDHWFEEGIDFT